MLRALYKTNQFWQHCRSYSVRFLFNILNMFMQFVFIHSSARCAYTVRKRCYCKIKKVLDSKGKAVQEKQDGVKKKLLNILSDMTVTNKTSLKFSQPESSEQAKRLNIRVNESEADDRNVASASPGNIDHVHSVLTKKLLALSDPKEAQLEGKSVREVFKGMVIESEDRRAVRHGSYAMKSKERAMPKQEFDIFSQEPLDIFHCESTSESNHLNEWKKLEKYDLEASVNFVPANAFEEMIQWTEQGKYWKFPLDNEIGLEFEESFGFHEHVFLEGHLKGFPKKGPIRHFMELVVAGLSKNPYISVVRKVENIEWFEQYFNQREHILKEYGVLEQK